VGLGHSLREALRAAARGQMTLTRRAADALGSLLDYAHAPDDVDDDRRAAAEQVAGEREAQR
jgi:hypothetical protein